VSIITLLTDFGDADAYCGLLHGVILGINPRVRIVDLCHQVAAQDIRAAAFLLEHSYSYFPKGTVHVCVVDPTVGSFRRALLVETTRFFFVGPDNGVLSRALSHERIRRMVILTAKRYFRTPVSTTFHGRDIFAPVAAHLSRGVSPERFGERAGSYERLAVAGITRSRNRISGQVEYIDRYGNLVTDIKADMLPSCPHTGKVTIEIGERRIRGISHTYSSVRQGALAGVIGSFHTLEIAVNGGSAARVLKRRRGDRVTVSLR
jgi:S-adenosyl-L-methionine hydrolase (adenosine-forming)